MQPLSEDERALEPGSTIGSRYEVVRPLAKGGMGVVYEVKNVVTEGRFALKLLRRDALIDPEAVERFAREARAAGGLRSPHVARVLNAEAAADGTRYIVMELLDGHDLHRELGLRGRIPVEEAVGFVLEACAGLAEAHAQGIVHRDLKPANLFLARVGPRRVLKIVDFGISKKLGLAEEITRTHDAIGTPSYMSPEQIRDARVVDARSDIWALGVVLYRMLTGELPFRGTASAVAVAIAVEAPAPPSALVADLPAEVEAIVLRALAKDPAERFANVAALASALAPFARKDARAVLDEIAAYGGGDARADSAPAGTADPSGGGSVSGERSVHRTVRAKRPRAPLYLGAALVVAAVLVAVAAPSLVRARALASLASPASSLAPSKSSATGEPEPPPDSDDARPGAITIGSAVRPAQRPALSNAAPKAAILPKPARSVQPRSSDPSGQLPEHL